LALAALRENKKHVARKQFTELVAEFPENPLFTNELVGVPGELILWQVLSAMKQCYIGGNRLMGFSVGTMDDRLESLCCAKIPSYFEA
jgi:hypothetical protein